MSYIGNNLTVQQYSPQIAYFSGNASTTTFTLPVAVVSSAQIIVVVANVVQNPSSAYTVSGTTLTFSSAPPSGTNNIWVEYTSLQTNLIQPAAGTVGITQLSATGTPNSTTYLRGDNSWAVVSIPSGSVTNFIQATAPTGWTQVTTWNDYAFRIVSGTGGGTGGSVAFSTAFSSQNVGATTLSTSQIPNHYHSILSNGFAGTLGIQVSPGGQGDGSWYGYQDTPEGPHYPDPTGNNQSSTFANNDNNGGGSHTHSLNIAVQYVDNIICSKN